MKEYRNMSNEEQASWVVQFSEFLANDYANVKAMGENWKQSFERGLEVLQPMTMCQDFVKRSRTYMDYERRIVRMSFFVEELRKQVIAVDGSMLTQVVAPQKRRRGRPTMAEQAEMKRQKAMEENGKKMAVARVAGMQTLSPTPHRNGEGVSSSEKGMIGDLFKDNENQNENLNPNLNPNLNDNDNENENDNGRDNDITSSRHNAAHSKLSTLNSQLSLQEVKGMLSGEVAALVDEVAMLRSEMTVESEKAKDLALAGAAQDQVAVHTKAAAKLNEQVQKIYKLVDEDLARAYIRARISRTDKVDGLKKEDVLEKALHYYQKVTAANPAFEGLYIAQLAGAKEKEEREKNQGMTDKEKKKLLKSYRDYFLRKDVKPSEARLKKMEEKLAHMKQLGEEVEEYELVLEKERKICDAIAKQQTKEEDGKDY